VSYYKDKTDKLQRDQEKRNLKNKDVKHKEVLKLERNRGKLRELQAEFDSYNSALIADLVAVYLKRDQVRSIITRSLLSIIQ
jgi:hypothetical protein